MVGVLATTSGVNPCQAYRWFPADTALATFSYVMRGQAVVGLPGERPVRSMSLPEAFDSGFPDNGNVRSGILFGPAGIYTGTCAVPSASSVAFGVPVDDTMGTAVLTPANVRDAIGLVAANLDTQLDALPTAAEAATAVRAELATEPGRIDVAISTRLAPDGTLTRVTLTDTATTLTNAPTVPSAEEIAEAVQEGILDDNDGQAILDAIVTAIGNSNVDEVALVAAIRADLEREGGTLDTRLAAADYTEPPTAEANAEAVRDELEPELERVANCATVETTGAQLASLDG